MDIYNNNLSYNIYYIYVRIYIYTNSFLKIDVGLCYRNLLIQNYTKKKLMILN